ncbi:hypothetical protein DRA42_07620 [Ethanoligenens harbinense]|nr:hypothetical protein CXQ68_07590 [Ethanoligenens harbinense YUAN-3]AYF38762.1 hypothetical protein CXP51_07460 [Ethanoligenens harbinense]AYF41510.1 hypothetical protein CN246_07600 [Ethanoligenens harbinense]QCN92342.1 hypothetical protein DRA42_07620 [Ethanoligenens harbinense]
MHGGREKANTDIAVSKREAAAAQRHEVPFFAACGQNVRKRRRAPAQGARFSFFVCLKRRFYRCWKNLM